MSTLGPVLGALTGATSSRGVGVPCEDMTAISLFDGIGGFPLALSRVGIRTVATVEIDKAAAGVTCDQFPDARHFDDVTEVTVDDILAEGFCPVCGIVCAGWPCQDLSLAGRRLGLGGSRSGLFWEIIRLAQGLRPRWLILENVPGLLSAVCSCPGLGVCGDTCTDPHPVRGGACGPGRCMELHGGAMGAVLGALGELGYGFAYRVLDAQHFGVPQQRRRVVIVGCLGDWAAPAQVLLEPEGVSGDPAPRRGQGAVVTALTRNGAGGGGGADDNTAQGGHLIASMDDLTPTVQSHHGHNSPGQDPLIATGGETEAGVRRLTPLEQERLQGYPDGWTTTSNGRPQADAPRYRQTGNSIAVPVFHWLAERIAAHEKARATDHGHHH